MLRDEITKQFNVDEDGFLSPDYNGYCLSNVPDTLLSLFNVDRGRRTLPEDVFETIDTERDIVILLLIDGFGYQHWKQNREDHSFFNTITEQGRVTPLTTIFPSTTSATLTTISTGLPPQEHQLPEWTVYYKEYDQTIYTLPFLTLDYEPLQEKGYDIEDLFDGTPIYDDLPQDVEPIAILHDDIADSAYSQKAHKSAETLSYHSLAELAVTLRHEIEEGGKKYIYAYISDLDTLAHEYGPHTDVHRSIMSEISHVFQRELIEQLDDNDARNALLCITADHGQVNVDPSETTDLLSIDGLTDLLKKKPDGDIIPPTGSPRDVFLHIREGKINEAITCLEEELGDTAVIRKTEDALDQGLFGVNKPGEAFKDRIGDILIVPKDHETVWYEDDEFDFLGHHGGMDPEEMLVPFAVSGLEKLQ